MSDKRTKTDEPGDPRVSAAYREMADERTPEHLDHVILNAARGAAKPRWRKAGAWLRPAAWVATIGLCVAIVVEISLLPDPEPAEFDSLPPASMKPPASADNVDDRVEKTRAEPRAAQQIQKPDRGRAAEAASPLRQQADSDAQAPASFLSNAPAAMRFEEAITERYCDETATADPDSWLECILELERQGLHEAARLERERLALAFPPPELP
ncbi:MAG TPA: hypothetical protein VK854_12500 [Woeseiaceae bacterium]|nr:hypothetical protein [Woeseiaceae bacterium]